MGCVVNQLVLLSWIMVKRKKCFWNKFSDTLKFPDYSNIRNIVYDETIKLLYSFQKEISLSENV